MGFDNPVMFYLIIGVPIFGLLFLIAWRHFRRFENSPNLQAFKFGSKMPPWYLRIFSASLKLLALTCIIIGLSEPYFNKPNVEPKYKNIRIFLLLDVSGSMIYAEDIKPNRLTATRSEIQKFYKKLDGNYEFSLIPFAGSPNIYYCPLTYSKSVFLPLLDKVGPESAPTLGTDIPAAVDSLKEKIKQDKLDESGVNIVLLLTDGGKEEADASNRIKLGKVVGDLANKNCKFYVVGIGGQEPAVLVRRDKDGNFIEYVKEDNKIAYSQLDEEILKQIAFQGNGEYLHFEHENQLEPFLADVLKENRIADKGNVVYKKEALQCYLYATAVVLLWLSFIANRRREPNGKQQQAITSGQVNS